jgi:hypothetical protein
MLDEYYGLGAHMENIDAGFKQTGFKVGLYISYSGPPTDAM